MSEPDNILPSFETIMESQKTTAEFLASINKVGDMTVHEKYLTELVSIQSFYIDTMALRIIAMNDRLLLYRAELAGKNEPKTPEGDNNE